MSITTRFARLSVLLISAVLATAAQAQVVGYNFRTGDAWVDTRLGEINDYGSRYRDPFIDEMTGYYGAPRSLVTDLFGKRWSAGDIYYACAIAHILGVPCVNVVHEYERNPGQGWGALAKRMGIKPGSPQFHDLKNGFSRTYDRWGYPVAVDRNVHVDWSQHGPGKSKGKGGGSSGQGQSHADHGETKAKAKGDNGNKGNNGNNGKGKDKGK